MKRFLAGVLTILAVIGCQNPEDKKVAPETVDKISVAPKTGSVESVGGEVQVIVSSSSEWTLAGKADYSSWVIPSAASGKDGDIVTFAVQPNTTPARLVAEWTFTCGTATDTYVLTSLPEEVVPDNLELVSDATQTLGFEEGRLEIVTKSSIHYRQLTQTLSEGAEQWLTYKATLEGDNADEAKFIFDYAALESLEDRSATVTISADGVESVIVELTQEAKHVLEPAREFYTAKVEGETISVPVTANVAYSIAIGEDGQSWISHKETKDGSEFFEVQALSGASKRSSKVTFTQTDVGEGETPLTAVITVTQQNALISWAVRMNGNRLFPKWENSKLGTCYNFTLECLIKPESFKSTGSIMTIMGIEGQFLLRFGDTGNSPNRIQIATQAGNWNIPEELPVNRWTHVAITFGDGTATAYFNGQNMGSKVFEKQAYWGTTTKLQFVDLSPTWSYEPSGNRCFWIGYSYDSNRDFQGLMTEFRIWKKTLTEEEINAENHFYTVDPASEGLACYWKVTSGEGDTIANAASGGANPLYGETTVRKQGSDNIGDSGIVFEAVSLPEE